MKHLIYSSLNILFHTSDILLNNCINILQTFLLQITIRYVHDGTLLFPYRSTLEATNDRSVSSTKRLLINELFSHSPYCDVINCCYRSLAFNRTKQQLSCTQYQIMIWKRRRETEAGEGEGEEGEEEEEEEEKEEEQLSLKLHKSSAFFE